MLCYVNLKVKVTEYRILSQQTENICITFRQRQPNVFDVGQHCINVNLKSLILIYLNSKNCAPLDF